MQTVSFFVTWRIDIDSFLKVNTTSEGDRIFFQVILDLVTVPYPEENRDQLFINWCELIAANRSCSKFAAAALL